MDSRWYQIFVLEEIDEAVRILKANYLEIEYNESLIPKGLAMGYIDSGNAGIVMSCKFFRKKASKKLFEEFGVLPRTSLEIRSEHAQFEEINIIIENNLTVIDSELRDERSKFANKIS
jgi:hypothetical protein